jgi:hypothetical protein
MRIIAHHTCDLKGDITKIEADGAFLSEHLENSENDPEKPENDPEKHKKHKMLGTGYYFFDNNITMAHAHGKNHYNFSYYIFEAELHLHEDNFLDLVGNRISMLWLLDMKKNILNDPKLPPNSKVSMEQWKLGQWLEYFKIIGVFPYKAIRATDHSYKIKKITPTVQAVQHIEESEEEVKHEIGLMPNSEKFINLQPTYSICLLEKDPTIIRSFKYLHTVKKGKKI